MSPLMNEVAVLLYTADNPAYPWSGATQEERDYYLRVADVMIDAVIGHLEEKDESYRGAFRTAIDYLRTETELARLRSGSSR